MGFVTTKLPMPNIAENFMKRSRPNFLLESGENAEVLFLSIV
jgi:hypothetical protein